MMFARRPSPERLHEQAMNIIHANGGHRVYHTSMGLLLRMDRVNVIFDGPLKKEGVFTFPDQECFERVLKEFDKARICFSHSKVDKDIRTIAGWIESDGGMVVLGKDIIPQDWERWHLEIRLPDKDIALMMGFPKTIKGGPQRVYSLSESEFGEGRVRIRLDGIANR
jgi:hypothetical protein